jgi:anti-sigma factor RsiW
MVRAILPVFLALGLGSSALWADEQPRLDLQAEMTAEEFAAAGLSRLSAEERLALETWLANRMKREATAVVQESMEQEVRRRVREEVQELAREEGVRVFETPTPRTIQTTMVGTFRGWQGRTLFPLANGMVFRQLDGGRMVDRIEAPEVRIERTILGGYRMFVKGVRESIGVERVQ